MSQQSQLELQSELGEGCRDINECCVSKERLTEWTGKYFGRRDDLSGFGFIGSLALGLRLFSPDRSYGFVFASIPNDSDSLIQVIEQDYKRKVHVARSFADYDVGLAGFCWRTLEEN